MQVAAIVFYAMISVVFVSATYTEGIGTRWDRDRILGLFLSAAWPLAIVGALVALANEKK